MILPTPGRVVWFTPAVHNDSRHDKSQPLAAIVSYVWHNRMVNLSVIDQNGTQHAQTSVALLQDGDAPHEGGYYAQWMPYQIGQAKKHEAQNIEAGGNVYIEQK